MNESTPLKLAVIGAGPVGLALALHPKNHDYVGAHNRIFDGSLDSHALVD